MRVLETARLRLRPLDEGDEAFYCRLYADPGVMRHVGVALGPEAARRSFRAACRQAPRNSSRRCTWVMTATALRIDIGLLALVRDARPGGAEIGALLLEEWQNLGYAAEAIAALLHYAFGELRLARVHTRHVSHNTRAAGLMRKLGFCPIAAAPPDALLTCRWQLTPAQWHPAAGDRLQSRVDPIL